jgi:hypothetical protein
VKLLVGVCWFYKRYDFFVFLDFFTKWFCDFIFPSKIYKKFSCSMTLLIFSIARLFNCNNSGGRGVVSYCGLICICMMVNCVEHLFICITFSKSLLKPVAYVINWIVCFIIKLWELSF